MKESFFKKLIREEINRALNETEFGGRENPPNIADHGYISPVDKTMFGVIKRLGLKAAETWFKENPRGTGPRARYSWPIYHDRFQAYKSWYEKWAKAHGMKL